MGCFIVGRTMKMCLFLFGSRGLAWMVWCQIHWIFMEIKPALAFQKCMQNQWKSMNMKSKSMKIKGNSWFWKGRRGFFEDLASKIMNGRLAGARRDWAELAGAAWAWPSPLAGLKNLVSGTWPAVWAMVMRGSHIFSILSKDGQIEPRRSF